MKMFSSLLTLALLGTQVLALPADFDATPELDTRATITCSPKKGNGVKKYSVNSATAEAQAKAAGLTDTTSGFPHRFFNSPAADDGKIITWGKPFCDGKGSMLLEYPIYESKNSAVWDKNAKKDKQKGGQTPIRVVFANDKGTARYCGVMVHKEVDNADNALNKDFSPCT